MKKIIICALWSLFCFFLSIGAASRGDWVLSVTMLCMIIVAPVVLSDVSHEK